MSQTILDEYVAEFDRTGVQPDPAKYGFSDMLNMLVEASCVMENLGESANRSKALQAELNHWRSAANKLYDQVLVMNDESEIDRLQTELAAAKSAILFMPPADIPNTYMAQVDMRSRCYSRLSAIGTANNAPADVAHQWQPVEDETDIDCSCDDPNCTSAVQVDGSYLLAFCEGAFVQMDLGEYRICRRVQHD